MSLFTTPSRRAAQYAPRPAITAGIVRAMIVMSSQIDQFSRYEVEPDQIVEREPGAPGDLPEPGHPRQHAIARAVPVLEQLVVAERERPRPDEAHLSLEHVADLRDLVQRQTAEDTADPRTRGSSRILKRAPSASFASSMSGCKTAASATVRNLSMPNSRSPTPILLSTKRIDRASRV